MEAETYGSYSHQKRSAARTCPDFLVELDDAFHAGDCPRAIVSAGTYGGQEVTEKLV